MKENIKKILDDVYAVDNGLKKYEAELIEMIEKLLASKPAIKFNKSFQSKLRAELLEKFSQNNNKKINFNYMNNKLFYAFGALALVLLLIIPSLSPEGSFNKSAKTAKVNFDLQVKRVNKNAFGPLVAQNTATAGSETAYAIGRGGGGGGGVAAAGDMATQGDSKLIYPQPIEYKYVYAGEEFSLDNAQMEVLKKIKGSGSQNEIAQFLQNVNFDNISLESLDDPKLRNFTIYEDKEFGYSIYVDLYEGMISINETWERWPIYNYNTYLEPLKIENIPGDDQLIAMANQFLNDYGISTDIYGEPRVDNSWREIYTRTEDKSMAYVPDVMTVVYPLIIDGRESYEEWGGAMGLRVSINVRYNKVNNMWNLNNQKYQSSIYDMETDVNKILDLASRGGNYYYYYQDPNAQTVEITLGTPRLGYMQTWQYADNVSNELLVPALIFPVTNIPTGAEYFYRENVVIPLAKEIINQRMQGGDLPVQIMEDQTVATDEGVATEEVIVDLPAVKLEEPAN